LRTKSLISQATANKKESQLNKLRMRSNKLKARNDYLTLIFKD